MALVTRAEVLVSMGLKESDFTVDSVPSLTDIDDMITSIETNLEEKFGTITPTLVTDVITHKEESGVMFFLDRLYLNSITTLEKNTGTPFVPEWEAIDVADYIIANKITSLVRLKLSIPSGHNMIRYTGTFGIGELGIFKDIAKAKVVLDINNSVYSNMSYKGGNKEFKIGSITLKKSVVAMVDAIKQGQSAYDKLMREASGQGKVGLL